MHLLPTNMITLLEALSCFSQLPCFVCAELLQLVGEVPAGRQQLALPAVASRMVALLTSPGYRKAQVSTPSLHARLRHLKTHWHIDSLLVALNPQDSRTTVSSLSVLFGVCQCCL